MGIPGVGPVTALAFKTTIDRPDRFRRSADVGAYLGLAPRQFQSGETDRHGRIAKTGDEFTRTALFAAANASLNRLFLIVRLLMTDSHINRGILREQVTSAFETRQGQSVSRVTICDRGHSSQPAIVAFYT
jgi:Transposase IS116/IS110/IS902 family